ncbi:hypothetical protein VULLAG_LOCUS18148 [Vulpes lagopus]
MHREPDVGFDPGSPGSRPGPKAGAKPLCHPGIPLNPHFMVNLSKTKEARICSGEKAYTVLGNWTTTCRRL